MLAVVAKLLPAEPDSELRARYFFVDQLGEDIEFESWFGENDVLKACRLDWNFELLKDDLPPCSVPIGCCATGEILLARFEGQAAVLRDVLLWDLLGDDRLFEGNRTFSIAGDIAGFYKLLKYEAALGRGADVARANRMTDRLRTPKGYTWHYHKGSAERLQLVPSEVHRATYFS